MAPNLMLKEATVVSMKLDDERYAVGVIARIERTKRRKPMGICVYFFGPFKHDQKESVLLDKFFMGLNPVAKVNTSALDIYSGEWKIVGQLEPWNRDDWPLPEFYQHEEFRGVTYRIVLDENDLLTPVVREEISDTTGLEVNVLHGSEAARRLVSNQCAGASSLDDLSS
jgi:hypothetical protein